MREFVTELTALHVVLVYSCWYDVRDMTRSWPSLRESS